ncbi:Tetratricopeptide (TPR) repeat [Lentzea albidocapillata subsp. violacea]|uniref:Tetratricopeptide (TPR) repeat n=1 Tax=Lentzea albidocapillata subsp. violacea TaxID=128104 RepID=A0A1G8ZGM7_9PSEU|nr:tetratricopeptide repeat protein [Lentzea albidocapillata]SDK14249.1 Tetratricopeptide (TPR) repeat [Lentzea albidocapillata subsp. violacea]
MDETRNEVTAAKIGAVVQAGSIGSVHLPGQSRPVPKQLPAAPRHFVGRTAELALLDRVLGGAAVIGGAGGVGKTWLALRWAHSRLDAFPDGRLHVDLQGFAPGGRPLPPAVAVRSFLDALGVAPGAIPVSLPAQAALYRSLVAGRRMLVVLDNAAEEAQVEPLLPGSPSCTVLVTSRRFLRGLVANHSAEPVGLDVLSEEDSRAVLTGRLGENRIGRHGDAVDELVSWCGGLPLALATVAARARQHGNFPLSVLAEELREDRLDGLRSVLSWSCRLLSDRASTLFGLLGHAPGLDIGFDAAVSLVGLPAPQVREVLRELEDAHLVHEHVPRRYRMHDLVRSYAAEQAVDHERGLRRLTDFYLHTAHAADHRVYSHRRQVVLGEPEPGCAPLSPPDDVAALSWLDAEHRCLLETQRTALALGWYSRVGQLAHLLTSFHYRRGHLRDQVTSWERGLAAAERLGDVDAQAKALRMLGNAHTQTGDYPAATARLRRALELANDLFAQGQACMALAMLLEIEGGLAEAVEHGERAVRSFAELGDSLCEADALGMTSWLHVLAGHHDAALPMALRALAMHRELGNRAGEAVAHNSLGQLAQATGRYREALEHHEQALAWHRHVGGDAWSEPNTLDLIGQAHAALGNSDEARAAWQGSVAMYEEQFRLDIAAKVRARLNAL